MLLRTFFPHKSYILKKHSKVYDGVKILLEVFLEEILGGKWKFLFEDEAARYFSKK